MYNETFKFKIIYLFCQREKYLNIENQLLSEGWIKGSHMSESKVNLANDKLWTVFTRKFNINNKKIKNEFI